MMREVDKALRMLLDLRSRIMEKYTPEDREALQRRLIIGPVENPPVYSAIRCFQGADHIEVLLKKSKLTELDWNDLLFHLTVLQTVISVFEGASTLWTNGNELLDVCGKKLNHWVQGEGARWPFRDHIPL
jgi:hypothetical protein